MQTNLTFIIPVRHFKNSKNWSVVKQQLSETLLSLSKQTNNSWKAIVVANRGSDLPNIPHQNISIELVDFEPNALFEQKNHSVDDFHKAVKYDKGRRVLAGMLRAAPSKYFMVLDNDDFVNKNLVDFLKDKQTDYGWYFDTGYIWPEGTSFLFKINEFYNKCGSCFIIRSDLFELPDSFEKATDTYIREFMGSHMFIKGYLEKKYTPLIALPFSGAMYRAAHAESHSQSGKVLRRLLINKNVLCNPKQFIKNILSLRYLTETKKNTFM